MKKTVRALTLIFIVFMALSPSPAAAQDEHHAGLVIVAGDGAVTTACVPFAEESIDGYELLQRAGLDLSVEAAGTGVTLCAIDGEGCTYPQESCFCRCQGTPCVYWSFWLLEDAGWHYATLGASYVRAENGDVQGWRWAQGTLTDAPEPPAVSFDEICPGVGKQAAQEAGTLVSSTVTAITAALTTTTNMVRTVTSATTTTAPSGATFPQAVSTAALAPAQADQGSAAELSPALGVTVGVLLMAPIVGLALWAVWRRARGGSR